MYTHITLNSTYYLLYMHTYVHTRTLITLNSMYYILYICIHMCIHTHLFSRTELDNSKTEYKGLIKKMNLLF